MKNKKNIKSIMILAAVGIATLFFINTSFAAETAKVNVETANLREEANSNGKILVQLSYNEEVEVLKKDGEWYQVKVKEITGYLREDLITIEENNTTTNTETETNQEAENSEEIEVETEEVSNGAEELSNEEETTKKVAEDTKLKIVPAINATDIIEVKKDEEVTIIETLNDWVCIQTKTSKGWIRKEKLKSAEEVVEETTEEPEQELEDTQETQVNEEVAEQVLKTLFVNSETVNLRKEANTTSEVVGTLTLNMAVDVYAEEDGWSKVKASGKEGYVSSALLSDKKQETTSRAAETTRKSTEETTKNTETTQATTSTTSSTATSSGSGANVVATAKSYIGSSYVYGATGPSSFDCSGFTLYIYKQYGITLNRTAAAQYSNGVAVSKSELQPGDLVMFGKSGINHVGIYIGGGEMVHAANSTRGVTTDTINSGYYNTNYVGARRVL